MFSADLRRTVQFRDPWSSIPGMIIIVSVSWSVTQSQWSGLGVPTPTECGMWWKLANDIHRVRPAMTVETPDVDQGLLQRVLSLNWIVWWAVDFSVSEHPSRWPLCRRSHVRTPRHGSTPKVSIRVLFWPLENGQGHAINFWITHAGSSESSVAFEWRSPVSSESVLADLADREWGSILSEAAASAAHGVDPKPKAKVPPRFAAGTKSSKAKGLLSTATTARPRRLNELCTQSVRCFTSPGGGSVNPGDGETARRRDLLGFFADLNPVVIHPSGRSWTGSDIWNHT